MNKVLFQIQNLSNWFLKIHVLGLVFKTLLHFTAYLKNDHMLYTYITYVSVYQHLYLGICLFINQIIYLYKMH